MPELSEKFQNNKPSVIRSAQQKFSLRTDKVTAINVSTGNVSLPMHPAMIERMSNLNAETTPFLGGIVRYTSTAGFEETRNAFLNILKSSGIETGGLHVQVTDGGSHGMELVLLGITDAEHKGGRPVLLIDPSYTNYSSMAARTSRRLERVNRHLSKNGKYELNIDEIEDKIKKINPSALIVIPYDNPTGDYFDMSKLKALAELTVKYDMWLVSDEAYRELYYGDDEISSIWKISEKSVPGITGRRISLETASKVWNACGLRIGGIISDNEEYLNKSIAENTANLCANAIGQYIFGALENQTTEDLQSWYLQQRNYYKNLILKMNSAFKKQLPGAIISAPVASIYSVIDFKDIAKPDFNSLDFIEYCATKGSVSIDGKHYTALGSPMTGFYDPSDLNNPGKTQIRIAFVETPDLLDKLPLVLARLFEEYNNLS